MDEPQTPDWTPAEIKQLMDKGALTDDTASKLRPSEMAVYQKMRPQAPPPEGPHKGLYKAAVGAAGMALPGLIAPEVAVPMWLMEMLGGAAGTYLGGKMGNSQTPILDAAEGAAPAAIGPSLHGLGSLIDSAGPMGRMIGGYAAGTAVGHPYIGAGIGRAAAGLGEGLESAGDTISSVMPGAVVRRGLDAMRGPAEAAAEVPLPRPNATSEAFGPSTGTTFGPASKPTITPGSSSDTPFWRRQPVPGNLEQGRANFNPGEAGNALDVPHQGIKVDMAPLPNPPKGTPPSAPAPKPDVTPNTPGGGFSIFRKAGPSRGLSAGEEEGIDSLGKLQNAMGSGSTKGNGTYKGAGGGFDPAEFPPGTDQHTRPDVFRAKADAYANKQGDPQELARMRRLIEALLGPQK